MASAIAARRFNESHALASAALIGPLLSLYAPLGMAPLFAVTAAAVLGLGFRHRPWRNVWNSSTAILCAILAWAALSLTWTIEPTNALVTVPRLIGLTAGGMILVASATTLDDRGRRRVGLALATGTTLALIMVNVEIHLVGPGRYMFYLRHPPYDSYIPRLGRGLTVSAILMVPAMMAAWRAGHRAWSLLILGLATLAIAGGQTLSAKMVLLATPVLFFAGIRRPALASRMIAVGAMAIILSFPLLALLPSPQETADLMPHHFPNSTHHRLTIWNFTAVKAMEHPLLGWGIEASRSIPGAEDWVRILRYAPAFGRRVTVDEQFLPLHPHCAPGQFWLELGGIGALLLCALMAALTRASARIPDRRDAAIAAVVIGAVFVVASVSYGIWQSWWLGTLWLTAAFCVALRNPPEPLPSTLAGTAGAGD
jgi:O-antigen ligase